MRKYLSLKNINPFSIIPLTFHITKGLDDPQFEAFKLQFNKIEQNSKNTRNVWIVKPGENTNRGCGITISYGLDDITMRLKGR